MQSIFQDEASNLSCIYSEDFNLIYDKSFIMKFHPYVGGEESKYFVVVDIKFFNPINYPNSIIGFEISQRKGLDEDQTAQIIREIKLKYNNTELKKSLMKAGMKMVIYLNYVNI